MVRRSYRVTLHRGWTLAFVPSDTVLSTDEMGRVPPPILRTVGRDGVNAVFDVFIIQSLLNDRLPKPHSPIPVTGVADIGTTLAIEAYQAVVMNMVPPTGTVEPGSLTYYSLASRPLVEPPRSPTIGHFGRVPADVAEAARVSFRQWGVPASVTIAQWAVESAWGAAMPPNSNNPFGIKAVGGQPGVDSMTREVEGGQSITKSATFRMFASLAEAFEAHGKLLATVARYRPAMAKKDNPDAFADALTGLYATDPLYGTTLKYVIHNYGMDQFDR
jgi:hypothetical protein